MLLSWWLRWLCSTEPCIPQWKLVRVFLSGGSHAWVASSCWLNGGDSHLPFRSTSWLPAERFSHHGGALHPQTSRLDCCWNHLTFCLTLVFSSSSSFISRDCSKAHHIGHSPAQKPCMIPQCYRRGSQFLSLAFKAFCNMTHVCCSAYLTRLMFQPNETVLCACSVFPASVHILLR